MTWLVTGGAGYIGANFLHQAQQDFIVIDDLSTGFANRIKNNNILYQVNLQNIKDIDLVFNQHKISGVIHFAAKKQVAESVLKPDFYHEQNVGGFNNLIKTMHKHSVKKLVFSSSASVYGQPETDELIKETDNCNPINPYGLTKLNCEKIAKQYVDNFDFAVIALRYFNVAGSNNPELIDRFTFNLIPIVLDQIKNKKQPVVFGNNYDTPDGSCIRDYIHVTDLADAHILAMDYLESVDSKFDVFNVGTGTGNSVLEVLSMIEKVADTKLNPEIREARSGDPSRLVADVEKIRKTLNWESKKSLLEIVADSFIEF